MAILTMTVVTGAHPTFIVILEQNMLEAGDISFECSHARALEMVYVCQSDHIFAKFLLLFYHTRPPCTTFYSNYSNFHYT